MIRRFAALSSLAGWRRFLVLVLCGAVAALALPPLDIFPAFFIAFALAFRVMEGARSLPQAFIDGWGLGSGYFAVAFHWIGFAFLVEADTYLWMMPFAVGGLALSMAIYWGLAALVAHITGWRGLARYLVLAAALAIAEWLRGHLFTGFPWAAPGQAAEGLGAVLQIASVVGMTGLTVLMFVWSAACANLTVRRGRHTALALLALLPLAGAWGAYRLADSAPASASGPLVRIVQPNIPQDDKWRGENGRAILDTLLDLSRGDGAAAKAVIWPESALPFALDESQTALSEISAMLGREGTLIAGSLRRSGGKIFNSVQFVDGSGAISATYDKWRLVPGGEFLPFESILEPLGFRRVVTVPGSFQAGNGPVTITADGLPPVTPSVCYEAVFPHRFVDRGNRPQWIANVTNDAWFGNSTGPHQHLAQLRLRAIEQGIPAFRAANTGISAIIDPYGRYLARLKTGVTGFIERPLPAALSATPYARYGDWIFLVLTVVTVLAAAALRNHFPRESS
ncbi:MAG: apolipoprotein N-acyltransferase [Aestuariivirga sp.]